MNKTLCLFGFVALLSTYAQANDIYVPKDFITLGEAIRASKDASDRVVVTNQAIFNSGIVINHPISILSSPAGSTIITTSTPGIQLKGKATKVVLDGFTFKCAQAGVMIDRSIDKNTEITIKNSKFISNGKTGLMVNKSVNLNLVDCQFVGNKPHGIAYNTIADSERKLLTIEHCEITSSADRGMTITGPAPITLRLNDTIFNDNRAGLVTQNPCLDSSITACSFLHHTMGGVVVNKVGKIGFSECSFSGNGQKGDVSGVTLAMASPSGASTGKNTRAGIVIENSINEDAEITIRNSKFINNIGSGLVVNKSVDLDLRGCQFVGNQLHGLAYYTVANSARKSLTIGQCEFTSSTDKGVTVTGPSPIAFRMNGSLFKGNNSGLVTQNPCLDSSVTACVFQDHKAGGAIVGKANRIDFYECGFVGNRTGGLDANNTLMAPAPGVSPMDLRVSKCTFGSNLPAGIYVRGKYGCNLQVINSTLKDSSSGISLSNTAHLLIRQTKLLHNVNGILCTEQAPTTMSEILPQPEINIMDSELLENNFGMVINANKGRHVAVQLQRTKILNNKSNGIKTQHWKEVKPDELSGTLDLSLDDTDIQGNQNGIYLCDNGPLMVQLHSVNSRICENKSNGINIECGFKGTVDGGEISKNAISGIIIGEGPQHSGKGKPAELLVAKCRLYRNHRPGIAIGGDRNTSITVEKSELFENSVGINFRQDVGTAVNAELREAKFYNNETHGISFVNPVRLHVSNCEFHDNKRMGIVAYEALDGYGEWRGKSTVSIENSRFFANLLDGAAMTNHCDFDVSVQGSDFSRNGSGGLVVVGNKVAFKSAGSTFTNNAGDTAFIDDGTDAIYTAAQNRFKDDNIKVGAGLMLSGKLDAEVAKCHFAGNSQHGCVLTDNPYLASIKEPTPSRVIFSDCIFTSSPQNLLQVLGARENYELGVRHSKFSQGTQGISLSLAQGQSVKLILSNSELKDILGAAMQFHDPLVLVKHWPQEQARLGVLSPQLAADLVSVKTEGKLFNEDTHVSIELAHDDACKPDLLEKMAILDYVASGKTSSAGGELRNAVRRYADIANCLAQARAWRLLGDSVSSKKLQTCAEESIAVASADGMAVARELIALGAEERNALEDGGIHKNPGIIELLATKQEQAAEKRFEALRTILILRGTELASLDGARRQEISSIASNAVQLMLGDIVELMERGTDLNLYQKYADFLRNHLMMNMAQPELTELVCWLCGQEGKFQHAEPKLALAYNLNMASLSGRCQDNTREADHLEKAVQLTSDVKTVTEASNRLTAMYIDIWKIPNKAIEAQQLISAKFPNTTQDFDARMKVSKILYEQKEFPKAIFELGKLLAMIPKDYDANPVQILMGLSYLSVGNYESARNSLAQIINKDTGAYREKALYLMGYSFISQQKYAEAVKPFKDLKALYPHGQYAAQANKFLEKLSNVR